MAEYFDTPRDYIENANSLKDKIRRIDQIIESLMLSAADPSGSGNVEEYSYNDGQTIVKSIYRSPKQMTEGIMAWQNIRSYYQRKLEGGVIRLQDHYVNRIY